MSTWTHIAKFDMDFLFVLLFGVGRVTRVARRGHGGVHGEGEEGPRDCGQLPGVVAGDAIGEGRARGRR